MRPEDANSLLSLKNLWYFDPGAFYWLSRKVGSMIFLRLAASMMFQNASLVSNVREDSMLVNLGYR